MAEVTCLPPFYIRLGAGLTEAHLRHIRTNLLVISEQAGTQRRQFDTTWGMAFVQSIAQCLLNFQFSPQYLMHNPSELELFRIIVQVIRALHGHHCHYNCRHPRPRLSCIPELLVLEQMITDAESEILDFALQFAFLLLLALKDCALDLSNQYSWEGDAIEGLALAQKISHDAVLLEIDNKFLDKHRDASQILTHIWQNEYDAVAYAQQKLFKGTLRCSHSCISIVKLIRDYLTWCTEGRPTYRDDNGWEVAFLMHNSSGIIERLPGDLGTDDKSSDGAPALEEADA
ncbi:hypothetical protein M413DRAFT_11365 [Hebeloma cylindrosporum]|uniref:Uncharacterized protein n=1 Tax=Hebeloma cylindrosporum TaxID=76867 RepID=A0A0C3BUS4_HEBCY|nr:hypothetical protein M413DRAFT_11365 [Hebeloma cylindrosporum h7]